MKASMPEITSVEIIESEIVLTFTPPVEEKAVISLYEVAPNPEDGNNLGFIRQYESKMYIPFSRLSVYPVDDYYIVYLTESGNYSEKVNNPDFDRALSYKVTLYDLEGINSSSIYLKGRSTPGAIITMYSYDYFWEPKELISKTIVKNDGDFYLKFQEKCPPYKPYFITANGVYFSPQQTIFTEKSYDDEALIINGSFQDDLKYWVQHPYIKDMYVFSKRDGYGNFKLNDKEDSDTLEIVQFVSGPINSKYKMTCEVRVNKTTSSQDNIIYIGEVLVGGGVGQHTRYDVTEDDIGNWITIELNGSFNYLNPPLKFGFTTIGVGDMDVRNITMREI